jgi:tagatose-1,6-bisphosphate aldolase
MHLPALQSDHQMFSVLTLYEYQRVAELLGIDSTITGGLKQLTTVFQTIVEQLSSYSSAIVAEPELSFPLLLHQSKEKDHGLLLSIARESIDRVGGVPQLSSNWGVDEVANNYAVAYVKLHYHPAEELALEKKKIIFEMHDYCQHVGIDLALDLLVTLQPDQPNVPAVFQETQLQALQEFRSSAELLMLQYPGNALAAATITAEVDVPWLVTLSAQPYEQVKQELRAALENGAQGFVVGEALWQEIATLRLADASPDMSAIVNFIKTTSRDRIIELNRISNEYGKKDVIKK